MTNAGFVSQLVAPVPGAMAGRSEQSGRRADEGEFSDLLSKFTDGKDHPLMDDQGVEGDARGPQAERTVGERQRVLGWLAGGGEGWTADHAIGIDSPEHSAPPNTAGSIVSLVAQVVGLPPVPQQTAGPNAPAPQRAVASVPLPAALADGQPAMPNDEALEPTPTPVQEVAVEATVIKRETHIAPGSAASGSLGEWAASRLGAGKGRAAEPAVPSAMPTAEPDVALSADLPAGERPQNVTSVAIAPLRAVHPGPGMKQGESPVPVPADAAGEALPEAVETEPIAIRMMPSGSGEQGPTPVQLIAARILQEAAATAPATATAAPVPSPRHALVTPTKVLHIQLQPAELGTVTLRMSLKDQTLRLEVEVGSAETGRMIQNDRDALSSLLRSAGYLVDGLDVRISDPVNAGMQSGSGQPATQMQGGGQSQADARSSDTYPRDGSPRGRSGDKDRDAHDQAVEADRRGGIFV